VSRLPARITAFEGNSVLALNGALNVSGTTTVFSSVDVQITNASGSADGQTPSGLGGNNLSIGYKETDALSPVVCSFSSVTGGFGNFAGGYGDSICGGDANGALCFGRRSVAINPLMSG
jgi:hypothetical protein